MNQGFITKGGFIMRKCLLVLMLVLVAGSSQAIEYVKTPGQGGNDGANGDTWATAKATIQAAITDAAAGEEIWVAAGTYSIGSSINISKAVTLYGGFSAAGGETNLIQRKWGVLNEANTALTFYNNTIIQGTGNINVIAVNASGATVDGFTITGGNVPSGRGGGVFVQNKSFTIRNCIIRNNHAGIAGGGMCVETCFGNLSGNWVTIQFCDFLSNTSSTSVIDNGLGGGLNLLETDARVYSCTFRQNTGRYGGGIYVVKSYSGTTGASQQTPQIYNCLFNSNTAYSAGGAIHSHNAAPDIKNCTFHNNIDNNSDPVGEQNGVTAPAIGVTNVDCLPRGICVNATYGFPEIYNCVYTNNGSAAYTMFLGPGGTAEAGNYINASTPGDLYADYGNGDFRPHPTGSTATSSIIDQANSSYTGDITIDRDGTARPLSARTGNAGGSKDRGAYEYDQLAPSVTPQNRTYNLSGLPNPNSPYAEVYASDVLASATDAGGIKWRELPGGRFIVDCSKVGTNNVTVRVTDWRGNSTDVNAAITVVDNVPPTAVCRASVLTVNLSSATVTAAQLDGGSSDNCALANSSTWLIDGAASKTYQCTDIANNPHSPVLTVRDAAGNTATCTATNKIVVVDDIPPTAIAKDFTLNLDVATTVTYADINDGSNDNCGLNLGATTISPNTFGCTDLGDHTVTLTVFDAKGNPDDDQCTVTVIGTLQGLRAVTPALVRQYVDDDLTPIQNEAGCGFEPYAFEWQYSADSGFVSPAVVVDGANGHPAAPGVTVQIVTTPTGTPKSTLDFTTLPTTVSGFYRTRITDNNPPSEALSPAMELQVKPRVTIDDPTGGHRNTGGSITFSVTAFGGYPGYTFQWFKTGNPTPISTGGRFTVGGTSPESTLTINSLVVPDAGSYYCVATDQLNAGAKSTATANAAALTVTDLLAIGAATPASVKIYGTTHNISATATGGDGDYVFKWYYDADGFGVGNADVELSGALMPNGLTGLTITNVGGQSTLALTNVVPNASGEFRCTVNDGSPDPLVTSSIAVMQKRNAVDVTVNPATATRRNYVDPLTLTATTTGGFGTISYSWALDTGGGPVALANGPFTVPRPGFDPDNPGVYTVSVTYNVSGANTNVLQIDHPLFGVHDGLFICTAKDEEYPVQGLPAGTDSAQSDVTMQDQVAIIENPAPGSYYAGNLMEMSAVVIGGTPMQTPTPSTNYSYNWYYSTVPSAIPSIQNSAVSKFSVPARVGAPVGTIAYPGNTGYEGYYRIGATFPLAGGATSDPATHNLVRDAVHFTTSPADQTKNVTDTVQFDVAAAGGYPAPTGYVYFWTWNTLLLQDGQPHPSGSDSVVSINATTGQLTISGLRVADAGTYEVRANDANAPCTALNDKCTATASADLIVTNNISVTDDPDDLDLYVGDAANFQVVADGGALPYTYKWYWDFEGNPVPGGVWLEDGSHPSGSGSSVSGTTTATLTISSVQLGATPQASDAGEYYCVVSDGSGVNLPDESAHAVLAIYNPVRFTANPSNLTRWVGGSAPFTVAVGGGLRGERSLRWQVDTGSGFVDLSDGPTVSGATTVTVTVSGLVLTDDGNRYHCVATSPASDDPLSLTSNATHTSGNATLTVGGELTILDQPADIVAYVTDPAFVLKTHFEGGVQPYAADWRRTGVTPVVPEVSAGAGQIIMGAPNTAQLTVTPGAVGAGLYDYAVRISDVVGSKRSNDGSVLIANGLTFDKPLENVFVRRKQVFTWSVEVSGGIGDLHYQWYKDDGLGKAMQPVPEDVLHVGTQTADLRFNEVADSDAGLYMVEVSDDYTSISSSAEMTVGSALPLSGALGLAAMAFASALTGVVGLRRREKR